MKKQFAALSLAALMALSLTACAGEAAAPAESAAPAATAAAETSSAAPAAESAAPAAEEPAAEEPVSEEERMTISWAGYQAAPLGDDPYMLEYFGDKLNVNFDIWNIDHPQYAELLNVRLASGEIPDMLMLPEARDLGKYVAQDVLAPIPMEMIEQYMPNTLQVSYTDTSPGALELGKIDGEIFAIPAMNMGNKYRQPVVYNQNWLDKLGKQIPTTIEEFEDVIYAFANDDPDGNGTKDTYGLSQGGLNVLYGMYKMVPEQDYFLKKDGKLVYMPIEPEMKEALTMANKWYNDGVLDPEFITGENTGGYWAVSHSMANERIGVTVHANYYHWLAQGAFNNFADGQEVPNEEGGAFKEWHALNPDAKASFGGPLTNSDGVKGGIRAYNILMRFYGVGANAADVPGKMEKILEIYEFGSDAQPDDTLYSEIRNGMEGQDWTWAEQDRRTVITSQEQIDDPNVRYNWGCILWWQSGNINFLDRQSEWAAANGFEEDGIYSDLPAATETMARYDANLTTLREQAYIQIITGERPIEYFDEFVDQYLAQGGQEILDEINVLYGDN